ncbi:DUF4279 domain-containing protein (plasmid) [Delftia tsuruhatensis]
MPTSAHVKGQQLPSSPSGRIGTKKSGMWCLRAKETEPEDLDGQVSELLGQVTSDLAVWGDIVTRFRVDLFCGKNAKPALGRLPPTGSTFTRQSW